MSCIAVTLSRKHTGTSVEIIKQPLGIQANLIHTHDHARVELKRIKENITVSMSRTCGVFLGFPLYVADGRLYSSDAALYVDKY